MPAWFVNIAYIVFAAVMTLFLIGVIVFVVSLAACIREAGRRKGGRNV